MFNIAPEKWWLEYYFPFGMAYFQGLLLLNFQGVDHHLGIITHKYLLYTAYIGISHDGVRWARGTSNYPLSIGLDTYL